MTIDDILPYLDDYRKVFGQETDRYICPLSLRACEANQLSRGHIVNDALGHKWNATIPVATDVDGFFGTTVESEFINFMRMSWDDGMDALLKQRRLEIQFTTAGPIFHAFMVRPDEVEEKAKHFPVFPMKDVDSGRQCFVAVKTRFDDPQLPTEIKEKPAITWGMSYFPSHWVATGLKMAHLTLFKLAGYAVIKDPSMDAMRRVLMQYYHDRASREDAPDYFRPYYNAVKGAYRRNDSGEQYGMDTLRDNAVICHHRGNILFAITLMYMIADRTMAVTVPQCYQGHDIAVTTRLYNEYLLNPSMDQRLVVCRFEADGLKECEVIKSIMLPSLYTRPPE